MGSEITTWHTKRNFKVWNLGAYKAPVTAEYSANAAWDNDREISRVPAKWLTWGIGNFALLETCD